MNKLVLLFTMVFVMASCSINKSINIVQLTNTHWQLKSIEGLSNEENAMFTNANLSFSPSDSTYSGNNGCNMISGKFYVSQKGVIFGDGLSTKRYCQGINEQKFNEALNSTNRMQIKSNILFLFDEDKKLAEFIKE